MSEAARLFVARGYRGVSMREIAGVVGISKAGLYYYFRGKEDLLLAILSAGLERIEALAREARRQGPTARAQVTWLTRALFRLAPEHRALIGLASQEVAQLGQAARSEFHRRYRERFTGQIEAIVHDGIARGELRPVDARLATRALLGMMVPFLYPAHEQEAGTAEGAVQVLVGIFFGGTQQS